MDWSATFVQAPKLSENDNCPFLRDRHGNQDFYQFLLVPSGFFWFQLVSKKENRNRKMPTPAYIGQFAVDNLRNLSCLSRGTTKYVVFTSPSQRARLMDHCVFAKHEEKVFVQGGLMARCVYHYWNCIGIRSSVIIITKNQDFCQLSRSCRCSQGCSCASCRTDILWTGTRIWTARLTWTLCQIGLIVLATLSKASHISDCTVQNAVSINFFVKRLFRI